MMRSKLYAAITAIAILMMLFGCSDNIMIGSELLTEPIWVIEPIYDSMSSFSAGLSLVKQGGETFFIDKHEAPIKTSDIELKDILFTSGIMRASQYGEDGVFTRMGDFIDGISTSPYKPANGILLPVNTKSINGGYVNQQQLWYIPAKYYEVGPYTEDGISVAKGQGVTHLIDTQGNVVKEIDKVLAISEFTQGFAIATYSKEKMFVNMDGENAFGVLFEDARSFHNDLAPVKISGKWGYIDLSGELVIPPIYLDAYEFNHGTAVVYLDEYTVTCINVKGEILFDAVKGKASYNETFFDVLVVESGNMYGLLSLSGEWVVNPFYNEIYQQSNFFALVKGNRVGFYFPSLQKHVDVSYDFDPLSLFYKSYTDNFLLIEKSNMQYILDLATATVSKMGHEFISGYGEGLFNVSHNDKWGYVDSNGEWVIEPMFTRALPFSEGVAAVEVNGKWGCIANPFIYQIWIKDETLRIKDVLLLNEISTSTQSVLSISASIIKYFTGDDFDPLALYEVLGLAQNHISLENECLTLLDALMVSVKTAEYCGQSTACLVTFKDLNRFGKYSDEVSYAVLNGIIEYNDLAERFWQSSISSDISKMFIRVFENCLH